MTEQQKLTSSSDCPQCGGQFRRDASQDPDRLIDLRKRNAASPAVAARYAEQVQEKVKRDGVIHKCGSCGYAARLAAEQAEQKKAS